MLSCLARNEGLAPNGDFVMMLGCPTSCCALPEALGARMEVADQAAATQALPGLCWLGKGALPPVPDTPADNAASEIGPRSAARAASPDLTRNEPSRSAGDSLERRAHTP